MNFSRNCNASGNSKELKKICGDAAVNENFLTILTPTYNRVALLPRLYKSLCLQTNLGFQWLIVDDGSTDNTADVVNGFQQESRICIDYHKKQNGGKHTALNYAHKYIKGKYIVIVDSDDMLVPEAVDVILAAWHRYHDVAAIVFQKGDMANQKPLDAMFKGEYVSTIKKELNRGMRGDHCETFLADLFKQYEFPLYEGERFLAEGALWIALADDKPVVFSDKMLYLCDYQADGLSSKVRTLSINNPRGSMWHAKAYLSTDFSCRLRVKNAMLFVCYGIFAGMNRREIILADGKHQMLIRLCYLPGKALYAYWSWKYGFERQKKQHIDTNADRS